MENERTCPHCGSAVPVSRVICPHCNRTLPASGVVPPSSAVPPYQGPAYASQRPGMQPDPHTGHPHRPHPEPHPVAAQQSPHQVPPPGHPQQYEYSQPPRITPPAPPQDDTLGIVGLIFSIIGLLSCGCLPILCPVGLIMSLIAHNKRQTGVTLAGIVVGIMGTFVFVLSTIWMVYAAMHPELQMEMLRHLFEQMGMPMPPGLPMP